MATKASPRLPNSSVPSSSSSSSSSCHGYRNNRFGRERDVFSVDRWNTDASSSHSGNLHQKNWSGHTYQAPREEDGDLRKEHYNKQAVQGFLGLQPYCQAYDYHKAQFSGSSETSITDKRGFWNHETQRESNSAQAQSSSWKGPEAVKRSGNSAARPLSVASNTGMHNIIVGEGKGTFKGNRSSWNEVANSQHEDAPNVWNPLTQYEGVKHSHNLGDVRIADRLYNSTAFPEIATDFRKGRSHKNQSDHNLRGQGPKINNPQKWRGGRTKNNDARASGEMQLGIEDLRAVPLSQSGVQQIEVLNRHNQGSSSKHYGSLDRSREHTRWYRSTVPNSADAWRHRDTKAAHVRLISDELHSSTQHVELKRSRDQHITAIESDKDALTTQASGRGELEEEFMSVEFDGVPLPFVIGTCEDMCPAKEREQRERLRDLTVFECVKGNPCKTSKELAVKKFCRTFSGASLHPSDVRPLPVLWKTLQYLLNLLDCHEFPFYVVHNFLFDRTRAIRQELGMQHLATNQVITMYEEIIRFHILSEHELSQRTSGRPASDLHLNLQQLSKSLSSLFDLYDLTGTKRTRKEAEFRAYYLLLNMGSFNRHQAESLPLWFRRCPDTLLNTPDMKFARKVLRSLKLDNFKAFFQLLEGATFLQGCLMELQFDEIRVKALAAINKGGYKLHPIPLSDIAKILAMKEGDLEELCNLCNLSTGLDSSKVRCLLVKQSIFIAPKEIPYYRCPLLVSKKGPSNYEEVLAKQNGRICV